ncbi:hypothetical protein AWZ03_003193 [Drosophila navojoa]|uniref:Uncharacterized protein n=1 Tax=Drosophila navojoa TaxID=7232 RepID=A0A484BNG4_DRONA|nr:hypothetical protein AWZ03_003193 [Drosophila navojoa]
MDTMTIPGKEKPRQPQSVLTLSLIDSWAIFQKQNYQMEEEQTSSQVITELQFVMLLAGKQQQQQQQRQRQQQWPTKRLGK